MTNSSRTISIRFKRYLDRSKFFAYTFEVATIDFVSNFKPGSKRERRQIGNRVRQWKRALNARTYYIRPEDANEALKRCLSQYVPARLKPNPDAQ